MSVYCWVCQHESGSGVDYACCGRQSRYFYRDKKKAEQNALRHERQYNQSWADHKCCIIAVNPRCKEARDKIR